MLLPGFLRPVSYLQPFQRVEVVLFLLAGLSLALFQYRFHCAASVLSYGRLNSSAQLSIVTPSRHWWFFRYAPLMVFVECEGFEPPFCCRTASVLRCNCLALLPLNLSANLPASSFASRLYRGIILRLHQPLQFPFLNHSVNLMLRISPPCTFLLTVWQYHAGILSR